MRHPSTKRDKALRFTDRETEVQTTEQFASLGAHGTEGRAESMEGTVKEMRAPEGKVKAGSGQWERCGGRWGKCLARVLDLMVKLFYAAYGQMVC